MAPTMSFLDIYPIMLLYFSRMIVQGRELFIRMVTPRAVLRNGDLDIVIVYLLPEQEVPFGEICDVVLGLLVGDYGLQVRDVHMCVTPDFPKETKCIPICMPGSSFMHIVTYK
jgi:hypothetical protein